MKADEFCANLIKAFGTTPIDAPLRSLISKAEVRNGRGAYSTHRWVSLKLKTIVGTIESVNVMPYRYDIDRQSGNLHYWPDEVQFVACAREGAHAQRIGPKISAGKDGILLAPKRYFPPLTRMKGSSRDLPLDESFDTQKQLSPVFVENFQAFLKQIARSQPKN